MFIPKEIKESLEASTNTMTQLPNILSSLDKTLKKTNKILLLIAERLDVNEEEPS